MNKENNKILGGGRATGYPSVDKPWMKYFDKSVEDIGILDKSMFDFIYESNKNRMDNIAINYFGNEISYKEIFEKALLAARALTEKGLKAGDTISILSLNTPETIYLIYGANYMGVVVNLIGVGSATSEIQKSIDDTRSKIFFVLDKILDKLDVFNLNIPVVVLGIGTSAKGVFKIASLSTDRRPNSFANFVKNVADKPIKYDKSQDTACIIYTSGTTGVPKGVELSSFNFNAVAIQCALSGKNYKPEEKFLNILPPFIGFGIGMLHLCLYAGMTEIVVLVPKPKNVTKALKKYRPERFVIGPALTEVIENYPGNDLSFLLDLTGGGGAIAYEKECAINTILDNKSSKTKYLVGYGMTELASAISMNLNNVHKLQSIGVPLVLTNVKTVDIETGVEQRYGEEGELLISTPSLMRGYFNLPDETEKVIEIDNQGNRWIHTGDLAKIDEDGFVFITGRLKRIFITKDKDNLAYKIFPQRIEELVEQIETVVKCAVTVEKDELRENVPNIFVTLSANIDEKDIKEQILELVDKELPEYYKPNRVVVLETMPITSSQKINYRELENLLKE